MKSKHGVWHLLGFILVLLHMVDHNLFHHLFHARCEWYCSQVTNMRGFADLGINLICAVFHCCRIVYLVQKSLKYSNKASRTSSSRLVIVCSRCDRVPECCCASFRQLQPGVPTLGTDCPGLHSAFLCKVVAGSSFRFGDTWFQNP